MLFFIHFLHPLFLYGLFLLAIPILIHLFSFKRYKKVYFSNFNFLESLQQQKKNSSKLKNILLLLLRLLAITAIVIAFATPYTAPGNKNLASDTRSQVILYADNSFSMSNSGTKGSLLEEAKKHLFDIVSTYPVGSSFILLTNDDINASPLTKEQTIDLLSGLKTSAASKTLSEIVKEAREITNGKPSTLFIISDFQKKNCDFHRIVADSTLETVFLVLEPENLNNLYIKDVAFAQAFHKKDQNDRLSVTLVNSSPKEFNNVPVTLTLNDKKKNVSKIHIPAHSEKTLEFNYQNTEDGFYQGIVEISDFPVIFDNKFYFSYGIDGQIDVLCIEHRHHNPFFGKLFSDSTAFSMRYVNVNQMPNTNFGQYDLIIVDRPENGSTGLESALESYVANGGNLLILPGEKNSILLLNRLLQKMHAPLYDTPDTNTIIARIETEAPLFREVFEKQSSNPVLPQAKQYYHFINVQKAEKLLTDKKGEAVFLSQNFGQGNLYLSAFHYDPENSDMVYHPLFVPLMINMASNVNAALNSSYFLGNTQPVVLNKKIDIENKNLRIVDKENTLEFIPEVRKDFNGSLILPHLSNIKTAGLYKVMQEDSVVDVLACNYNREESGMEFCTEEELQKQLPQARVENIKTTQLGRNSDLIKEIVLEDNNRYLTFWFLLLAILALLAEQIVWRKKLM